MAAFQRRYKRFLFLAFTFILVSLGFARHEARAGFDFSGCPTPTLVDEKISVVAELQRRDGKLLIAVNPFSFFYSPETMLWLYFRQCALVDLMKDDAGRRPPTPEENQESDCRAIVLMQQRGLIDRFGLESIDRTVDPKLMQDFEKQLGDFRRIDVFSCAKGKS